MFTSSFFSKTPVKISFVFREYGKPIIWKTGFIRIVDDGAVIQFSNDLKRNEYFEIEQFFKKKIPMISKKSPYVFSIRFDANHPGNEMFVEKEGKRMSLKLVQLNFQDDQLAYRHVITSINNSFEKFADRFENQAKKVVIINKSTGNIEKNLAKRTGLEGRIATEAAPETRNCQESSRTATSTESNFKRPEDPNRLSTSLKPPKIRRLSGSSWSSSGYYSGDSSEPFHVNEFPQFQSQGDIQIGTTIYNEQGEGQRIEWQNYAEQQIQSHVTSGVIQSSGAPLAYPFPEFQYNSLQGISIDGNNVYENCLASEAFKTRLMQDPNVQVVYEPYQPYRFDRRDIAMGIPGTKIFGSSIVNCNLENSDIVNCSIENSIISNSNIIDEVDTKNRQVFPRI